MSKNLGGLAPNPPPPPKSAYADKWDPGQVIPQTPDKWDSGQVRPRTSEHEPLMKVGLLDIND
jgi:hypothetical protein